MASMFNHEGAQRSHRLNVILAGYLALVAGMVNSAGFIIVGSFTSHVTGNIGRLADDVALGHRSAATLAALMIVAFFAGAFTASMAIESSLLQRRAQVYGALLLGEAGLLLAFYAMSRYMRADGPRIHDAQAMVLCAAMGVQNSLVTRLSGAVVRTTHLTGVVTDLGIEAARWFRYSRAQVAERTGLRLVAGDAPAPRPEVPKLVLLATIIGAFIAGGAIGAPLGAYLPRYAFVVPSGLLALAAIYALVPGTNVWRGFGRG